MAEYALVGPNSAIVRYASDVDPTVSTRAGYRWLPVVDTRPPSTPTEPIIEGPTVTVEAARVTRVWTVRAKTAAEVDIDREYTLDRIDMLQLKVSFDIENRVRALEGKAPVTAAQYRAALKARL